MNFRSLPGFVLIGLLLVTPFTFRCGSRYNTIEQRDPNAKSEYVYGDLDGKPRQMGNVDKYAGDSLAKARAEAIREKWFGDKGDLEKGN